MPMQFLIFWRPQVSNNPFFQRIFLIRVKSRAHVLIEPIFKINGSEFSYLECLGLNQLKAQNICTGTHSAFHI
jgi:hypothetical protein